MRLAPLAEARRGLEVMGLLTLTGRRSVLDAREPDRVSLLASTAPRSPRGLDELSLAGGSRPDEVAP